MATRSPITVCGSLSLHPVSMGAAMHRAGYEALGLPYVYAPFGVTSPSLGAAIAGMRALGIRGLGVSMPFKLEVMPLCDAIAPMASRIGAVNTIVNDEGRLTGHNTDAIGAVRALEEARTLSDARCLVLGAGGAARAVVHALVDRGADVTVANRTRSRAAELAERATARSVDWEEAQAHARDWDVVINATSAGMDIGDGVSSSAFEQWSARPGQVVMDLVYKPLETQLVKAARASGAVAIHGGRMLLHQAAGQFELYTGRSAPLEAMDAALRRVIG